MQAAQHRIAANDGAVGTLTDRQRDVLEAVLELIVKGQRPLSMIAVARAASCSKETLYRWFGDRDGLLTATVRWQAAKVRGIDLPNGPIDGEFLHTALARFASDWLRVLTGPTSIALNRLAIAEAGSETLDLGAIVLRNGPVEMARRIAPLFVAARASGLIAYASETDAFSAFFGLVVGDLQIRMLLGDEAGGTFDIDRAADEAARRFMTLFGS
ncbi:TetR/AcrR family transcriptional regulator C-terminal domain-containing protein [Fulvimarina sp. MAC8]|uniref:TetR/AcrR family transcriptional regulator C-terminal domain-containing protein n=1 Tax=Fulvimarina sp. MAC8 TaxID=3162874 RepID=UPI0032EDF0D6